MAKLVLINGSPSAQSRTGRLLDHFAAELERDGWTVDQLALRTLPASALLGADFASPDLIAARERVDAADALVVATLGSTRSR